MNDSQSKKKEVVVIRSSKFSEQHFQKLSDIFSQFNSPMKFSFHPETFYESGKIWKRKRLWTSMNSFRQQNAIEANVFLVFLTTLADEKNWFSACLENWDNNIFVNTSEWELFIKTNQLEYPLAYEIVENLLQNLMSDDYVDYQKLDKHPTIGCINDMCKNKPDVIFKLRTADVCEECLKIIEKKVDNNTFEQFIEIIENIRFQFLHSKKNFTVFQKSITKAKIKTLVELKDSLKEKLETRVNEKSIQNWIDEDNGKYRSLRCLIFGVEYVNPKREGELKLRRRFDILAEQNLDNYIIIELKSPSSEVFDITENKNANEGVKFNFKLSSELSKAIPQILQYKEYYNQADSEIINSLGLSEKKNISELIIVIGRRRNDELWKTNFINLKNNMNIKIFTYDDLIDKMNNTIQNFEKSLILI